MDIEAIRKQVEQQVMQYFHLEPTVTDAPYAGKVTGVDVISHLEHSLLNPDTTLETIERECAVARKYSVAAVCVAPYYVPAAREILLGSPVAVAPPRRTISSWMRCHTPLIKSWSPLQTTPPSAKVINDFGTAPPKQPPSSTIATRKFS